MQFRFQDEISRGLESLRMLGRLQREDPGFGITSQRMTDEVSKLSQKIDARGAEINASIEKLNDSQDKGNVALYLLISTISTRIGSVLLLIFLVQILLSVYRYSVRLQNYYDARVDALLLANKSDADELHKIIAVLSPEGINFGKMPTSPSEHIFDTIKGAISTAKTVKS